MPADKTIDELLARAILDIELKMKHEIRQNNALQLAKMEKHHQQVEKRLSCIEAKLEALLSRETSGTGSTHRSGKIHYNSSARQQTASAGRTSYYARTANLANGFGGGRGIQLSNPNRSVGSPVAMAQPYGVFGSGGSAAPSVGAAPSPVGRPYQHKFVERKQMQQHRPKQTLGTGGNKTQLGFCIQEQVKTTKTWTTKVGLYTEDEDSGDDENLRSASEDENEEPRYSVAKPDDDTEKTEPVEDETEEPHDEELKPDDGIEKTTSVEDETEEANEEELKPQDTAETDLMVAVAGGFGKSRRK